MLRSGTEKHISLNISVMENERKMAEAAREREEITRRIEENAQYEKDQAAALKQKHLLYQDDLIQQMGYNNR